MVFRILYHHGTSRYAGQFHARCHCGPFSPILASWQLEKQRRTAQRASRHNANAQVSPPGGPGRPAPIDMERARAVAFEEKPAAKLSILEECKARCADARAKMKADAAKNASKNLGNSHGFSTPDRFRTLDAVKMLPNNRSRSHSASASRHASGARTAESVSQATTSLTVRSAVQIRSDRAFKEGEAAANTFPSRLSCDILGGHWRCPPTMR